MRPSPKQIKAARVLIGITQEDLAKAAGLSLKALDNYEQGHSVPREATIAKIVRAFKDRGVTFSNGESPTVKHEPSKAIIPC